MGNNKERQCVLGHTVEPQTTCVSTNIGFICAQHIPEYRRAVQTAIACVTDESDGMSYSTGAVTKRTKEILLGK